MCAAVQCPYSLKAMSVCLHVPFQAGIDEGVPNSCLLSWQKGEREQRWLKLQMLVLLTVHSLLSTQTYRVKYGVFFCLYHHPQGYRSALLSHHRHENNWFGVIVKNNNKPTYLFISLYCKNQYNQVVPWQNWLIMFTMFNT